MKSNLQTKLLETLEQIQNLSILVIGDLIVDRYIWGRVERISPEAPVPVVEVRRTEDRLGGAGNVVSNLRNLGVKVVVSGIIGNDDEGQGLLQRFESYGVSTSGIFTDDNRPTSVKTRVIAQPQPQQLIRIDREDKKLLEDDTQRLFTDLMNKQIKDIQAVIVSDYAKGVISPSVMKVLSEKSRSGFFGRKTIPLVVDPHPEHFSYYQSITMAKPNRREAEAASGVKIIDKASALEAAKILQKKWQAEMMMITLGEGGLVVFDGTSGMTLNTVARQVYDVSGAGDTVTAVFTAALAAGADVEVAGNLSNIAAGIVVSEVGTVPIDKNRLKYEIEHPHE